MTEQQAAYSADLAGAIAHANDSLDWIEARRDGPLPEDGYARIETSVGVVRALGMETTVAGSDERHEQWVMPSGRAVCRWCWFIEDRQLLWPERAPWPCDAAKAEAENARLRERVAALEAALQDASDHLAECASVLKRANRDWNAAGCLERVRQARTALAGQPAAGGA